MMRQSFGVFPNMEHNATQLFMIWMGIGEFFDQMKISSSNQAGGLINEKISKHRRNI